MNRVINRRLFLTGAVALAGLDADAKPPTKKATTSVSIFPSAAEQASVRKQFAAYPASGGLDGVIRRHLNYVAHRKAEMIVLGTTFGDDEANVAYYYEQNQKNEASRYRDVYNWALQGSGARQLSLDERNKVGKLLAAMPASNPSATLMDLLIVTYFDGKKWNTRLYDQTKLSGDFSSIDPEGRKHPFTSSRKP